MVDNEGKQSHIPYRLNRGIAASCRLNLQSSLWNESLVYKVHPDVKLPAEGACIADVGTGTGRWLIDLQQTLGQKTAKFDGLDIDLSQCPSTAWLDPSISFRQWDAFTPPPYELLGKYDLVHVRLFQINLQDNADKFIENVKSIIKPGGYLQWEEVDNHDLEILTAESSCKTEALQACVQYIKEGAKKHVGSQDWLTDMPNLLNRSGFEGAVSFRHIDPLRLARYCFETWMLTLTEFTNTALKGTDEGLSNMKMLDAAYEECVGGAVIRLAKRVCIAKKTEDGVITITRSTTTSWSRGWQRFRTRVQSLLSTLRR